MLFLSFDCAVKSLAICLVDIKYPEELYTHATITVNDLNITPLMLKVIDITEGVVDDIDTINRTLLLKKCLTKIDTEIANIRDSKEEYKLAPLKVLVEYQMSLNDKSRGISHQIVYHYSNINGVSVELVGPSLKNKIHFSAELEYGNFISKYSAKYTANKNHTKSNFVYWMGQNGYTQLLNDSGIKKGNYDDIADAFMQSIACIVCKVGGKNNKKEKKSKNK
jgi:hypothetical protein